MILYHNVLITISAGCSTPLQVSASSATIHRIWHMAPCRLSSFHSHRIHEWTKFHYQNIMEENIKTSSKAQGRKTKAKVHPKTKAPIPHAQRKFKQHYCSISILHCIPHMAPFFEEVDSERELSLYFHISI